MSRLVTSRVIRSVPTPNEYFQHLQLSRDNFGIHMVRWPYDPAINGDGALTSPNASRWPAELGQTVGWIRAFDPSMFGRYTGGAFVQVGMTAEGSSVPYGRIEGVTWYQGMLRSDGSYDFSKLALLLAQARAQRLKVLLNISAQGAYFDYTNNRHIELPLPTGEFYSTDPVGYQIRVANFLDAMFAFTGNDLAAIEAAGNEPGKLVRLNTTVGPGHTEQLAVITRIAKQLIKAHGLSIEVLSPPFQGGETGEITAFLKASSAGISIGGDDGTGRTGCDWIDALAHHNYGNFSDRAAGGSTVALDASGINDPVADGAYPTNTSFTDMLSKGRSVAAAANAGGWYGKRYNTECHVTGSVSTSVWGPRHMTQSGMERIFFQTMVASFASGYEKCMLYAGDHPSLGFYDNTGTPPAGEPADWYFKAPDNTARGAAALANVINAMTAGEIAIATTSSTNNPAFSISANAFRISSVASGGIFL